MAAGIVKYNVVAWPALVEGEGEMSVNVVVLAPIGMYNYNDISGRGKNSCGRGASVICVHVFNNFD